MSRHVVIDCATGERRVEEITHEQMEKARDPKHGIQVPILPAEKPAEGSSESL